MAFRGVRHMGKTATRPFSQEGGRVAELPRQLRGLGRAAIHHSRRPSLAEFKQMLRDDRYEPAVKELLADFGRFLLHHLSERGMRDGS